MRGAVLGSPIGHSLSPLMHRSIFNFLGIECSYSAIEVHSGKLHSFFEITQDDYDYFSLTMPLKEEVLSLGFDISGIASKSQSANTLYRTTSGWSLTSTDGTGFLSALHHRGISDMKRVLILGAGGTARAVAAALDGVVSDISINGRSLTRKESFESIVTTSHLSYQRWSDAIDFEEYDLVVNTTPAGAADLLAESISLRSLPLLFDVIYKPWPTVLASRWGDCGGSVINGLELLIYQGIEQVEIVTGNELDKEELAEHLRPILNSAR